MDETNNEERIITLWSSINIDKYYVMYLCVRVVWFVSRATQRGREGGREREREEERVSE